MKKGNSLLIKESIFLLLLSILSFSRFVRANPVAIYPVENPYIRITVLTIFFLIGTSIEYVFFKNYLNKFSANKKERNKLLSRSIIKINLITYPITQILAYVIYLFFIDYFFIFIFFLEIGVVIIEWRLLKIELERIIDEWTRFMSIKQVLLGSAKANLFSFLIGLIGFLPAFF